MGIIRPYSPFKTGILPRNANNTISQKNLHQKNKKTVTYFPPTLRQGRPYREDWATSYSAVTAHHLHFSWNQPGSRVWVRTAHGLGLSSWPFV